ncbi:hypothetical protein, partial [Herbaspirillum sp. CF444]|uniref:hypothetical protein n=1 Tax=Herbaspirillum sp. CF444 TaxID=1144319 RepID=UPI001ED94533
AQTVTQARSMLRETPATPLPAAFLGRTHLTPIYEMSSNCFWLTFDFPYPGIAGCNRCHAINFFVPGRCSAPPSRISCPGRRFSGGPALSLC